MKNLLLWLSYDGSQFFGWQRQKTHRSVQGELETALTSMFDGQFRLGTSSRTDAGVHARRHPVSVSVERDIPPMGVRKGLNALTPYDLSVIDVQEVPGGFSARKSAMGKTYRYRVRCSTIKDPFLDRFCWRVPWFLDADLMQAEARCLLGEHDFSAFRAANCDARSPVRLITSVHVERDGEEVWIQVGGNAFLRNMVRIIAGSLVEVGRGHRAPGWLKETLESKDRTRAGTTAPGRGLCLMDVTYPPELVASADNEW